MKSFLDEIEKGIEAREQYLGKVPQIEKERDALVKLRDSIKGSEIELEDVGMASLRPSIPPALGVRRRGRPPGVKNKPKDEGASKKRGRPKGSKNKPKE